MNPSMGRLAGSLIQKETRSSYGSRLKANEFAHCTCMSVEVSESVIRVSELTRRFGGTTALDSVSVSFPRGAVYTRRERAAADHGSGTRASKPDPRVMSDSFPT